jgi:pimeloyl-ACP methyl ester carboxylesterase
VQRPLFAAIVSCSLLFGVQATTLAQTASANGKEPPLLGKLIDVGGYRVHLYCIGTGSPAVIIVGAGFSFDWGLVQPEAAKFTQVCSYDHSGIGWSEDGPKDSCSLRVNEVHTALKNAGIPPPYVLVGHSLGALVARIFAGRYPDEVAGIVFVDHAVIMRPNMMMPPGSAPLPPPPPNAGTGGPPPGMTFMKPMGLEDDPNFSKLPAQDREAHLWFMTQPRNQKAIQTTNGEAKPGCFTDADAIVKEHSKPLGDKPLVDVDTNQTAGAELQNQLLSLSSNSKEMTADNSGHFVIIDRPDVVVDAISRVVRSARTKTPL